MKPCNPALQLEAMERKLMRRLGQSEPRPRCRGKLTPALRRRPPATKVYRWSPAELRALGPEPPSRRAGCAAAISCRPIVGCHQPTAGTSMQSRSSRTRRRGRAEAPRSGSESSSPAPEVVAYRAASSKFGAAGRQGLVHTLVDALELGNLLVGRCSNLAQQAGLTVGLGTRKATRCSELATSPGS